jgi:hypothetical protein
VSAPLKFSQLSATKRMLIRAMQNVNYGSILNVTVAGGDVKFDPQPDVLVDIRLDEELRAREEIALVDFDLSTEVRRMLAQIDLLENGTIERIVVHSGLPRRIVFRSSLAQRLKGD